ncbi:hypothetical protein [Mesorhizobium sp. WSM2239]|uniref:Uncharacterized protein n=2 Tax=unclassified Mesorhizobium TaxID=325217 RepID=A0AAU8DCJ2_9HYPH
MTNETYPTVPTDYPRELDLAEIKAQRFLFLGEAIEWIISRGKPSRSAVVAERWDAAERELFDFLDAESVDVQGYPAPNRPRIHETLPRGIWARMNKGNSDDPWFSPVDDSEEREDGGSLYVGDLRWDGVRLPTSFVLKHWPPNRVEAQINRGGAPTKGDWPAIEEAFRRKVQERGLPEPLNEDGWQRQADVERWIADVLAREGTEVSETTLKNRAREFMSRARGQ